MILSFKKEINGKPTYFQFKIWACDADAGGGYYAKHFKPKIHTIRKGYRFKQGTKLHLVVNARTPEYFQFNKHCKGLEYCISVQKIRIRYDDDCKMVWIERKPDCFTYASSAEIETLAQNDGFDNVDDFWAFFKGGVFEGQIIHWTDYRYQKEKGL